MFRIGTERFAQAMNEEETFGKAPSHNRTYEAETELQKKISRLIAKEDGNEFTLDGWYMIRDRFILTTKFLQNEVPRRLISLPSMRLIGPDDIRQFVEPRLDEWVLENINEFKRYRPESEWDKPEINPEAYLSAFLKESAKFAILSHRWSKDEMSFQDIIKLRRLTEGAIPSFIKTHSKAQLTSSQTIDKLLELSDDQASSAQDTPLLSQLIELLPHIPHSTGLVKLINFCALAQNSYQCSLAWIDTCCIDKTSSAELDEAIRSMFRWYQNSGICIIHLADTIVWPSDKKHDPWFTRGWTLQELLAPPTLKFYTSEWKECTTTANDKSDQPIKKVIRGRKKGNKAHEGKSIVDWLSEITKVPTNDLLHFEPGLNNIRQRLDWASERQTTRVEDMAYCLLGIFDVSMTIAYGEGSRAFHRLQQAVMERSNDRSLFLWTGKPASVSSMLANEPKCFKYDYRQIDADISETSDASSADPAFTLTNHGLRIAVSLYSKEQSLNWLKARTSDTRYKLETCWDKIEADEEMYQGFRLAVLGYSSGKIVLLLLVQKRIRGHLCYERYPGEWTDNFYGLSEEVAPAPPQIIYVR